MSICPMSNYFFKYLITDPQRGMWYESGWYAQCLENKMHISSFADVAMEKQRNLAQNKSP